MRWRWTNFWQLVRCSALLVCFCSVLSACDEDGGGDQDVVADIDVADTGDTDSDGQADGDADDDTDATGDADVDLGEPDPPVTLDLAEDVTLTVDPASVGLTLSRAEETLLDFGPDGIQLGVVNEIDGNKVYSPYGFTVDDILNPPPPLREWLAMRWIAVEESSTTSATLEILFQEGFSATLTIAVDADGRAQLTLAPGEVGDGVVAFARLRPLVSEDDAFYGLGELMDSVEHRGRIRAMQLELDNLESGYNEAHVPVPFLIGTRGWGLFVQSRETGVFDMAANDPGALDVIFSQVVEGELDFWLFAEEHPLDITRHYYDVTGYPVKPARWALGPWIWRDENDDQEQVESDVSTIRDLDLAATAYWIDRPYASGVNSFDFSDEMFTDEAAMVAEMHDLGFRLALWHTPYVDEEDPDTTALHQEAVDNGYFPPVIGNRFNNWSDVIDFTNPDAYGWWQDNLQYYIDLGVEGFKLDYAEDVVTGGLGVRLAWEFADGSTERTMHSVYQLLYHQAYAELLPETGGFLLCRAGTWGDQVNASVIWPGDLSADFTKQGEMGDDNGESFVSVGGLPAALIAGLSLGPSGFPLYGSDTGGYRHSPPDKETFTRWFQITALSPVMQVGTSTNDVPWEFNAENGFDQQMLDWYRIYARLHLRLWPYVWTYLQNIDVDGRPIQRALGLAYPELGVHPDDVFLLGDHLLVAPVVERDARTKTFTMPPGQWVNWWSDEILTGDQEQTVDAPLSTLPLYQRQGSIIPLLRPTIDAMAPTGQPMRVDSFSTDPGLLWARVAPGDPSSEASAFQLYDGSQLSQQVEQDGTITLGYATGDEFDSGAVFELVGQNTDPSAVTADGNALMEIADTNVFEQSATGWYRDAVSGRIYVKVEGDASVSIAF